MNNYKKKSEVLKRLKDIEKEYLSNERKTYKSLMKDYKTGKFNLKPTPVKEQVISCMDCNSDVQELKAWLQGYEVGSQKCRKGTDSVTKKEKKNG